MNPRKLISIVIFLTLSHFLWAFSASQYSFNGTAALKPSYIPVSSAKSVSHLKGAIGEFFTEDYISQLKKTGWVSATPRNVAQGIDHVFIKFRDDGGIDDLIMGETKFKNGAPSSFLGNTKDGWQMSENWIKHRMSRDVISQYLNSPYLIAENNDSVVISSHKPQSAKIEKGSITYIDKDSFYYKRKADPTVYFYDGNNKYGTSIARTTQMKRIGNTLTSYTEKGNYRRRVYSYEFGSDNVLIQRVYDVIENVSGEKPKLVPSNSFKEMKFTSAKAKADVANSEEFKNAVLAKYGLIDDSFFDEIDNVNAKLRLVNDIDGEIGRKILSSKENMTALATKFGLNQNLDFKKLALTDFETNKLFTAKTLNELPNNVSSKLSRASMKITLRNAALFGGVGLITSFASEMFMNNVDLSQVDWKLVGYTTCIMTTSSLLQRGAEKIVSKIVKDATQKSATMKLVTKIAPASFAIGIDTIIDLAFTGYALYTGDYSLKQAAAVTGLNFVTNTAIFFGSQLVSSVVTGAIAGSWGGPIGITVGSALAVVLSVGTNFIINPITEGIELSDTLSLLNSNDRVETVRTWTTEYLSEAV